MARNDYDDEDFLKLGGRPFGPLLWPKGPPEFFLSVCVFFLTPCLCKENTHTT